MLKKLYKKIDELFEYVSRNFRIQCDEYYATRDKVCREYSVLASKLDNMSKTIVSQQHTIEQLTNAIQDKYEHGLFVVSNDCKMPLVIRNGETVLNERATYFRITWAAGEEITIETEYR